MIELLESLRADRPFSFLDSAEFASVERSINIAYYPKETHIIKSGDKPSILYFIIKGVVEASSDEEIIDIYQPHDMFGAIEMIEDRASDYDYRVTEELICYEMPREIFLQLTKENNSFKSHFFSSIADRIDMIKNKKEFTLMSDLMVARVDSSLYHDGCVVSSNMSTIEALRVMEDQKASSLIIDNDGEYGIVTDADLRGYILHRDSQDLEVISSIQTKPIISARDGELLFNVLLQMTQHSIKHLIITDDSGEYRGVLELIDLLSFFSNQSHLIVVQMQKAKNLDDVVAAAKRVETMVGTLHARGVKSRYIAKLVSEINRKMYIKLFEMVMPVSWHDKVALLLLGSEGRGEQILRTDQDNALIFEDGFSPDGIEEVTTAFIEILDKIGFPRCSGGVMIINEKWHKSLSGYKSDIDGWISSPSYDGFMDMAILYDSVAVAGKAELHEELRSHLVEGIDEHKIVLSHFARAIENFESPLGLFSQFITDSKEHEGEIDIKKGAIFALVHGVRALALEYKISDTNTTVRIKELTNLGFISKDDAKELIESLEVLSRFRLHAQLEKLRHSKEMDNYISTASLSKLERDTLKDALRSVDRFKKLLSHHFHLSMVG